MKKLLNIEETSDYLGIKVPTLYSWGSRRKIPFIKVSRLVKFDPRGLKKWLKSQTQEVQVYWSEIYFKTIVLCLKHHKLFTTLDLNILFLLTIVRYPMAIYNQNSKWFIDYYYNWKRKQESVGTIKKLAQRAFEARKGKIAQGHFGLKTSEKRVKFNEFSKE